MGSFIAPGRLAETDPEVLESKQQRLFEILRGLGRVIVAFSGGTDSAFLAWAAHQVLGENALAVTADSPTLPEAHKRDAEELARRIGFRHRCLRTHEFENPDYLRNDPDRCFYCKDELFSRLEELGRSLGIPHIVYGVNADDLGDYRPGHRAARLHQVRAPLLEAGLGKAEIRELSRRAGLPTWDRPASACLASRIPYGTPVTVETVKRIERGEEALHALGFRQCRVRHHGDLVRLEIAADELPRALTPEMARRLVEIFKPLGYHYVTLDLEGYRQGSLNAPLVRGQKET